MTAQRKRYLRKSGGSGAQGWRAASLLAGLTLLATACSGSPDASNAVGDSADGNAAPAATSGAGIGTTEADSAGELTPLTVIYTSDTPQYSELTTATELGLFEKHGLDVELKFVNGSSQVAAAIQSGEGQIALGNGTSIVPAFLGGVDGVFLGANVFGFTQELYGTEDIQDLSDLRGKKLATTNPGSLTDQTWAAILEKADIDPSEVELISFSDAGAKLAAMIDVAVDAGVVTVPDGLLTIDSGMHLVYDASELHNLTNSVVSLRSFAENPANRDTVINFFRATREAMANLRHNRDTVQPLLDEHYETDPELSDYSYDYFQNVFRLDPTIDPEVLEGTFETAAEVADVSLPEGFDAQDYYIGTFAEEFVASGFLDELAELQEGSSS